MKQILKLIINIWLAFSTVLSKISTTFLLSIIFFFIIGPISILSKFLRKDFLSMKKNNSTNWKLPTLPVKDKQFYHQF